METYSLIRLAAAEIRLAVGDSSGRSACVVHGGCGHSFRQIIWAFAAGHGLAEHQTRRQATLEVLTGHVRLRTTENSWDGRVGDYLVIPSNRHSLEAFEDSAVLLTLATTGEE